MGLQDWLAGSRRAAGGGLYGAGVDFKRGGFWAQGTTKRMRGPTATRSSVWSVRAKSPSIM